MKIYPNPTTGQLTIEGVELKIENVEILDILGRMVKTYRLNSSTNATLDVSELSNGTYFVSVYSEGQKITRKFVKE